MERQIQRGGVFKFKLNDFFALAARLKLGHAVVAAYSVPEVDDVVALAKLGKIEELVNLRAPRQHSSPRFEPRFLPPPENFARASKDDALCVFGKNFPIRAPACEIGYYKALSESARYKLSLKSFSRRLEYSAREPFVAFALRGYQNVDALFPPFSEPFGEPFAAFCLGLKPVAALVRYGCDFGNRARRKTLFFALAKRFRRSVERRYRDERVGDSIENFAEAAVRVRQIFWLEK